MYKNDNSVCLHFRIMSPDPYFFLHFRSITLHPLKIFSCLFPEHSSTVNRNILMILGRIIEQISAEY